MSDATLDPRARTAAIDKAIEELGIDLLRELRAIAWFCDGSSDGKHALIPSDRRHWYEPSGNMAALTGTGCIRLLSPSYCETTKQRRPSLRMEQFGRQVLARARAMQLPIEIDDEPDDASPQPALAVKAKPPLIRTIENQTKETHVPKLTSAIALELVTRIEALNDQITDVYREAGEYDGINNINVIRDIVKAREEANDQKFIAEGILEALDEDEE